MMMAVSMFQANAMVVMVSSLVIASILVTPTSSFHTIVNTTSLRLGNHPASGVDLEVEAMYDDVKLEIQDELIVIDNGLLRLTLTNPGGAVVGVQYNGIENLVELHNPALNGGFWDLNWGDPGNPGTKGKFDKLNGTVMTVIRQNDKQVELSFTRVWSNSLQGVQAPLNIDKRFVMLRGSSGFYSYAIYEHLEDMPALILYETRIAFMLKIDKIETVGVVSNDEHPTVKMVNIVPLISLTYKFVRGSYLALLGYGRNVQHHCYPFAGFRYMAMADNRQRSMPLPEDRLSGRGQPLAYPEAVLLVNPIEPEFKGEVDDKYQYSCENKDNGVHGWICFDPPVGFWQICPSNEFRTGGPIKQDLTSHVNPTTLAMFVSAHYGGEDLSLRFEAGEPWKKVFGPVFFYLNSVPNEEDALSLWDDAKERMKDEVQDWPYSFPKSEDYPKLHKRGIVTGNLQVIDRDKSEDTVPACGAYIGLAAPGENGSWQKECKGYQFWTIADEDGYFRIDNIRPGEYGLFAWVPGYIGDYLYDTTITVTSGCSIDVGDLVYVPPRSGPTLWEIGVPDRTAGEFYIPDPDPNYINKLYVNHPDRFRQYGLWERYADIYPDADLVYTVGVSDYQKDWFFAHVNRKTGDATYEATTWQITFKLDDVCDCGDYKLRVALASATHAELQVRVNDPEANPPLFSSGLIGKDNAIARHGIHGLYYLFNVHVPAAVLVQDDENTIFLTQARNTSPFHGIMYDYIRLESPQFPDS